MHSYSEAPSDKSAGLLTGGQATGIVSDAGRMLLGVSTHALACIGSGAIRMVILSVCPQSLS